jgi:hypothetical protein
MLKKDSISLGILIGIIAPMLGFAVYKFVKFRMFSFGEMFSFMRQNPSQITAAVILSLVANLVVFTFFLNKKIDRTAKGVFIVTCIYAIATLIFKYLR